MTRIFPVMAHDETGPMHEVRVNTCIARACKARAPIIHVLQQANEAMLTQKVTGKHNLTCVYKGFGFLLLVTGSWNNCHQAVVS